MRDNKQTNARHSVDFSTLSASGGFCK